MSARIGLAIATACLAGCYLADDFDSFQGCRTPAPLAWLPEAEITPLSEAGAATMPDGRLLVLGGYTGGDKSDLAWELVRSYDPAQPAITRWQPLTARLAAPRSRMATVVVDGKVLLVGSGDRLQDGLFDPSSGEVASAVNIVPSLQQFFWYGRGVLGPDGKLYVLGGGYGEPVATVYRRAPADPAWTASDTAPGQTFHPMRAARWRHAAVTYRGRVWALGGNAPGAGDPPTASVESYVPDGAWQEEPSLPSALAATTAVVGADGLLYVIGGEDGQGATGAVFRFDPCTQRFEVLPGLAVPRRDHAAALGPDGRIYAIGGGPIEGVAVSVGGQVEAYGPRVMWTSGEAVAITGEGFAPGARVRVRLDTAAGPELARGAADPQGKLAALPISRHDDDHGHTVIVYDEDSRYPVRFVLP